MAKADRLDRLDRRREDLEADYREALVAALRVTASGKWGLFGHHPDPRDLTKTRATLENLADRAETIDDLRGQLALQPFALHAEFLAARGPVKSDAVGEPRQAQAWLARLDSGRA